MDKLILLDRDGTIIADKHYLSDPDGVEILPNAVVGLKMLVENGYKLAIVTNQSGIGRGYYSEADMHAVNSRMAQYLEQHSISFEKTYFCPHSPDQECNCRKPATGMVLQAKNDFNINPDEFYIIGDKLCDVQLGINTGAKGILVRTGKGEKEISKCENIATYIADDLYDAAKFICKLDN